MASRKLSEAHSSYLEFQTTNSSMDTTAMKDFEQFQEQLKDECTALKQQVEELRKKAKAKKKQPMVKEEDFELAVRKNKVKIMKALISAETSSPVELLPDNDVFQKQFLKKDLETCISQLKEVDNIITHQATDLDLRIKKEKEWLSEQKYINAILVEKLLAEQQKSGNVSKADLLKILKADLKTLDKGIRHTSLSMANFVRESFEDPTREDVKVYRRKHNVALNDEMVPLLGILEELLNKTLEDPHAPYIRINESYWPPFIEFLRRSGIVQEHINDDNLLKLTPFHL